MTTQFSPTWNNSGNTFTCIRANVIDNASANTSKLLDLLINNTSITSIDKLGNISTSGTLTVPSISLSGDVSSAAWTTNGIGMPSVSRTFTDTSSSGTVAAAYTNVIDGNTIAASSATTFTDYSSLYLGSPVTGTNVTITNPYSLITAGAAKFGGAVTIGSYKLPTADGTNGQVLQTNGSGIVSWATVSGGGGGGITSINGNSNATQLLTVGTSGTDFNIDSSTTPGTSVFNIPSASASARGLVTTGSQTFAGDKTFSGSVITSSFLNVKSGANNVLTAGWSSAGLIVSSNWNISWGSQIEVTNGADVTLARDAAATLALRNSTNAQTFNISNTYTSSTNFEYGRFQWNTNQFRIGTAVGSAGGTGRSTVIGNWDSAGTWLPLITVAGGGSRTVTHVARINNINGGDVVFSADGSNVGAGFTLVNNSNASWSIFSAGSATGYLDCLGIMCNNAYRIAVSERGNQQWLQGASSSGSPSLLIATGAAHTTLTASTEATDINFNLARTVQFAAGALTTQRAFRIQAPTYAFASASTITTAATLSISGPPVAGTNATLTGAYSIFIESAGYLGLRAGPNSGLAFHNGSGSPAASIRGDSGVLLMYPGGTATASIYSGLALPSDMSVSWSNATVGPTAFSTYDLFIYRDASATLALRNSTSAQTFRVYNTYTSATNAEWYQESWVSNEIRLGTAVGSVGGSQRSMVLGAWSSAGAWSPAITVGSNRTVTFNQDGSVVNTAWTAGAWLMNVAGSNNGLYTAASGGSGGKITFLDQSGILSGEGSGQNTYMNYSGWAGHRFSVSQTGMSAPSPFWFTDAAFTALAASTEMTSVNFNLAQTKTFAAGALTTQRAFRIQAPTYAFASASTITTASTLAISGAPAAGTNATITNAYALNVEGGASYFGGNINQQYSLLQSKQFAGSLGNGVGLGAVFITLAVGTNGIALANTLGWASSVQGTITTDVNLERDAAATLALRNSTNAQTFRVYNTFTSATNAEWYQESWVSNELRLGTAVGSAGGTQRDIVLGNWNSAGTWTPAITLGASGVNTVRLDNTYCYMNSSGSGYGWNLYTRYGQIFSVSNNGICFVQGSFTLTDNTYGPQIQYTASIPSKGNFGASPTARGWLVGAAGGSYASSTNRHSGVGWAAWCGGGATPTDTNANGGNAGTFDIWLNAGGPGNGTGAAGSDGKFRIVNDATDTEVFSIDVSGNLILTTTNGSKIGTSATQKLGFWNATPVVQNTGWSTSNSSSRKTIDATATNLNELIDLVCTLVETLKSYGIIGA